MLCLAPGGSLQQEAGVENGVVRCSFCVFTAADDPTTLKSLYEVGHCSVEMKVECGKKLYALLTYNIDDLDVRYLIDKAAKVVWMVF